MKSIYDRNEDDSRRSIGTNRRQQCTRDKTSYHNAGVTGRLADDVADEELFHYLVDFVNFLEFAITVGICIVTFI